ncbi:MAG: hypothetical protein DMG56_14050 [Acidobacteria bacterium]|nr:MAG: hypothetical protein DMG54_07620 [Acidobacteriota bacterium]PYU54159.1 MAG: hypothetical protein DMG55_32425 [Acidobacteriota bacterium]PYU61151.1 MAG: hypothetical protein DMG56_14050 [Acidobacteriota bacterium]PYU69899.1 MAG: hypothetical protein DMG52_27505 [Acidobacteriota bacterium]
MRSADVALRGALSLQKVVAYPTDGLSDYRWQFALPTSLRDCEISSGCAWMRSGAAVALHFL